MIGFVTGLACAVALAAQPAKDQPLDAEFLRTYAQTRGFMLGRPVQAKPTPDGKAVLFLRSEARKPQLSLYEFDVATGKTRELLTPAGLLKGAEETLSPEEKARRERMRVSLGGFTSYQLSEDGRLILLSLSGKLYVYDRETAKVRELKTGPGTILDPKFALNGQLVGYVRDYDVYVYDLAKDQERPVTTGGTEQKPHGLAEFVAQEEMDRFSGYWWSPDSKFIAYEEYDTDGVEVWYVADPVKPEQPPLTSYYPRPGKKNVSVRLGVVPVAGGETVWVEWEWKKYEYLASVRWVKHGPLTMTVENRLQNELALLRVDPTTGRTSQLLTETDAAFVNIDQDVPRWLDGGDFLWVSESSGAPQLERRTPDGKLRRVVVAAKDGYHSLAGVVKNANKVLCTVKRDPTRAQGLLFPLEGELREPLATWDEVSTLVGNEDGSRFVRTVSTLDKMPTSHVYDPEEVTVRKYRSLPSVAEEPPFQPSVRIEIPGLGNEFYAAIVHPRSFDKAKKYPVLVYVYGGPHHLQVEQSMRSWLLPQWIADQGFVVVALDNRGTPERGRDWERAIYQKFGTVPLEDQVAGLQALGKKYPEMDLSRVGIYGWSFGGYMSALAVLKRSDVFKAAVAGAPVTDWEDYDTHYTERYLGLPQDNPEVYKEASLLTYAAKLERPLLLVHGTADDNVYFRHSLKLTDALFRAGKDFEILPLSGLTHMVPDPVVMERLYTRIAGHFQKHLGRPN